MFSKNIKFENFRHKIIQKNLKKFYRDLISKKNDKKNLVNSFTKSYSYSFSNKQLKKYKKYRIYNVYGMGGSSLGAQAIYDFIKPKIKKNFYFFDNLNKKNDLIESKKKALT